MRRLNPTVAALVAGVLAVLLILYVLAGGSSRPKNPEKLRDEEIAGVSERDPRERCGSQQTYDLIKGELFRRAAELRGEDQAAFANVAGSSVVRMDSPVLTSNDEDARTISCSGSLTLELPPGLAVVGGRQSLAAQIGYGFAPAGGGGGEVLTLTNAEPIIAPLATLARARSVTRGPSEAPASDDEQAQPSPPKAAPPPAPPKPSAATPPAVRRTTTPPAPAPPRAAPSPPPPRATASPSFNCRNARTRGEIAVCNDDGLASLDRQMAAQFNRAVSAANPAQRQLLERTRGRFLAYRDSCGSEACMAGAYRDRMREISDIMAGRWNPR